MRFTQVSFYFILLLILNSCAKQSTPTGGPRDEDPPVLQESNPKDQSTNIRPEEIFLTFDEYVKLENPTKGIVITPRINKDEVEFTALKNTVKVKLNQELEDNTTYVFDFQKSVVDISEDNPAENLKLVFSTGNEIDSLYISGNVLFYFPNTKPDFTNVLVGIYPVTDTTDVFTAQPYYLSQVDTTGAFKITNIKNGNYLAYAWKDANGSLKAEFKTEEYDFILDTIKLESNLERVNFNLSKSDLTPIRILRSAPFGKNYDIIVNREPVNIILKNEELGKNYFYNSTSGRIRIYPKETSKDSIPFQISLIDSVGFTKDSLIWAKFPESERKADKLDISANSGKNFYQQLEVELKFNKPINTINFDSLYLQYDTTSVIRIEPSMIHFSDSLRRDILKIDMQVPDSIKKEIFTINAADSTFLDIEGQYNEKPFSANYRKIERKSLADEITGKIIGAKPPFIIQLIDERNELIKEQFLENSSQYSFKLVDPGTYKIRVIEDINGNKRWDPSNFIQKRPAERVFYFYNEEKLQSLIIRSGWTLEDQNIEATPQSGFEKNRNN
ncbi:MAG: Ig-like domain-containing protein [Algoriphagus sp.]|nr:Ig-like domain-containing protein [Algoriphagus sp.]